MTNREKVILTTEKEKIIAIMRGVDPEACLKTAEALYAGGIRMLEVTFNQKNPDSFKDTATAIRRVSETFGDDMLIGAGTVLTKEQVDMAAEAGGLYMISPSVNEEVIRYTRELDLVSMPGAMTPTEVMTAHLAGADFVKLFPVGDLGASYVKAIRGPISHVKLLAVGGVNSGNVAEFLKAGCVGAGVGGNLVNSTWISQGEFHKITQVASELVMAVK